MFACCTSKKVLTSVDLSSAGPTGPQGSCFSRCKKESSAPLGQSGPTGCTGPKCQGSNGCVNRFLYKKGPSGPSGPSGPTGPSGATGPSEGLKLNEIPSST